MNIISELSKNLHITEERRKEVLEIFKTIVLNKDTVSEVITELNEHKDICDNEKSYLIYTFALSGTAAAIKLSEMDPDTQDKFIKFMRETIMLQK